MPFLMLGIILTMGSMAFAQITCGISPTGPAIPSANVNGAGGAGTSSASNLLVGAAAGLALVGPSANATATGHTEPVAAGPFEVPLDPSPAAANNGIGTPANRVPGGGTIRVTCVNGAAAQTPGVVVLTVGFGVPITNTTSFPAAVSGIRLLNGTGVFITPGQSTAASNTPTNGTANATCVTTPASAGCANVGISSVSNSAGQVVIGLGTPAAFNALTPQNPTNGITWAPNAVGTFDLSGVLVSTNGLKTPVIATLSGSAGIGVGATAATANSAASTATAIVTTAVTTGLVDPTVSNGTLPAAVTGAAFCGVNCSSGAAVLLANGNPANGKNNFTIRLQENYPEMFKSASQFNGGGPGVFPQGTASSVQVNIVLSNVPTGLAISNCTAALTDTTGATNKTAFGTPLVTPNNAVSNTLNVIFQSDVDLTAVDVLWVTCQVGLGTATLPLPATAITAQVELAPVGTALSSLGAAQTSLITGNVPRYQAALQPAAALPIVTFPPTQTTLLIPFAVVVPGINTGIAVANTSTDPFGPTNGGATATDGTILFTLFKNDGTTKTFTTATVKSGTVYAANLSDILSSAGFGTSFTGYIFVAANFPNAHGSATIYDTSTGHAELSTPVLVVQSAGNNITSANGRLSPETLGQ